ncbi:MFS transporter, partial [Chloroflexota bacterium]
WLFALAALTFIITLLIIKFFIKETSSRTNQRIDIHSTLSVINDRFFLRFVILSSLLFFLMGQLGSTLSIFTVDRIGFPTVQYALLLTINGLIVICFQYPVARSLNQINLYRALILGGILYGVGYLSLGWIHSFNLAIVAIAVVTAGEIVFSPAALSIVGEIAPKDQRGRYMGFFGLSQIVGMSLAALLGGVLLDAFPNNYLLIWGTIAMFGFIASIGFQKLKRLN